MHPPLQSFNPFIRIFAGVLLATQSVKANTYEDFTYIDNGDSITISDFPTTKAGRISIPQSINEKPVTAIGAGAFRECSKLESVYVPDSVTSIGMEAFASCTSMIAFIIPRNVTSIQAGTFANCTNLASIATPNSVTTIGDGAFYSCAKLISIRLPPNLTSIGTFAFFNCSNLTDVILPNSLTTIKSGAFQGCSSITSIQIPELVSAIADNTFNGCTNLITVNIPNTVGTIGFSAFQRCTNLTSIQIPASVYQIAYDAFRDCSNLRFVSFEGHAPQAGSGIFTGAQNATVYYRSGKMGWGTSFGGQPAVMSDSLTRIYTHEQYTAAVNMGVSQGMRNVTADPNTYGLYTPDQVKSIHIGTPILEQDPTTKKFKLTIKAQKSTDLTSFSDLRFSDGQTQINSAGEVEFLFDSQENAAFFRIQGK